MQKEYFMQGEADAWFARNHESLGIRDPVTEVIDASNLRPQRVLEVGCSNGWRLDQLRARYNCSVFGIEPSKQAAIAAAFRRVPVYEATADELKILRDGSFDLIIYGFSLYLTDPTDWFKIVTEGDRLLESGGHLIVHDFAETAHPFARRYEHREGVLAYHVDFAQMWLAHPLYSLLTRRIYAGEDEMVIVLKKLPVDSIEVRE